MTFAPAQLDLSYWQKAKQPLFTDLAWNLPERKTGRVAVLGGNSQSFSTPVRISEYLARQFPTQTVATLLPDALRPKLPPLPNLTFFPSTASGSFDRSAAPSPLLVLARDSLDALAPEAGNWLMIMLSQPLVPALETLHKFTLSYPVTLCTFHQGQIITAHQGQIITTSLELTTYSPLTLWSGQLAANILALNLYNLSHPLEATTAALTYA